MIKKFKVIQNGRSHVFGHSKRTWYLQSCKIFKSFLATKLDNMTKRSKIPIINMTSTFLLFIHRFEMILLITKENFNQIFISMLTPWVQYLRVSLPMVTIRLCFSFLFTIWSEFQVTLILFVNSSPNNMLGLGSLNLTITWCLIFLGYIEGTSLRESFLCLFWNHL